MSVPRTIQAQQTYRLPSPPCSEDAGRRVCNSSSRQDMGKQFALTKVR